MRKTLPAGTMQPGDSLSNMNPNPDAALRHVVIVGGGSAGWLTAAVIAAEHQTSAADGLRITLLEAPGIPPIGVGEGTWPSMRDTLRRIGLSETELVRRCDACFKQGSRFNGWRDGSDADHYHHPFSLPVGHGDADLVGTWQARHAHQPFADLVSHQPALCARGLAPKQPGTPEYAAVANYGYHFDAGKFGVLLREHCLAKRGVQHVQDEFVAVQSHANGDIAALQTRDHGAIAGDLFIDCTGLRSLLLGEHFQVPFISQRHVLFNDRALALQVPYPVEDSPIASQTVATAQRDGWIWDIGLPTRRGVGHVYSSAHCSDDAAEAALQRYVQASGGPRNLAAARPLRFEPGYRARFWHRNCVAVGLAAGFIEPLEASALALAEMSAAFIAAQLPATRSSMDAVADQFNEAFAYRWERVIDFLKLHYVLTQRNDSDYWRDHVRPASVPERLQALLQLWQHRPPSRHDLPRIEEVFPSASYHYVLYGMGFKPQGGGSRRQAPFEGAEHAFREAATLAARMAPALPSHRGLIQHIQRHGLPRI
ncbi:tryptophan halogenase family protein [Ideonella sp.]|uniref:tryptophan halogenase family protein n=1 Tax=Ideonella sp. TaxID=1929293 RepID=UPI003BB50536